MSALLELAACTVDLIRGVVWPRGHDARTLTTRELDLLRYLVHHASRPVSRDEVLVQLWGYSDLVVSRACDNAIRRLREKIEADPGRPDHILTVHGTGYRFEPLVGEATPLGTPSSTPTPDDEAPAVVPTSGRTLIFGDTRVDLGRRRVAGPNGEDTLTDIEVTLLDHLAKAGGRVVDRRTLLREVWASPSTAGRRVDNVVRRIRTKIEPEPSEPRFLLTARGGGYRLELPTEPVPSPEHDGLLLGREVLVGTVVDAVRSHRWVLLVGPAGIGKTRVARRVATLVGNRVWVDLAGIAASADIVTAVSRALALDLHVADAERVGLALSRRRGTLLVLDNLEQAVDPAAELIGRWRKAAPDLRILGTSRVRLGLEDETAIEVGPLGDDDAIELFVQRARAASTGFVRPDDRGVLLALVRRLDGMPLAIELAAGRTPVFAPADLLARLDLDLLSRPRSVDPRHRTLRGVIEASWNDLPDGERDTLLQLSLFRSGFVLPDAEAILGPNAVDLVQALRDRSLLHGRTDAGTVRLGTWEAIREYVGERRAADPRDPERVRRHCAFLARYGTDEWLDIALDDRAACPARIDEQVARGDDFADAVELALALGETTLALRCCGAAGWVYQLKGPVGAGMPLCDAVLAVPDLPPADRARLLFWKAAALRNDDRGTEATACLATAASMAGPDDAPLLAQILQLEGLLATELADLPRAHRAYLAAAEAAERAGDRVVGGYVELLRACVERSLVRQEERERWLRVGIERSHNHPRLHAVMLDQLAKCVTTSGRLAEAATLLEEAARNNDLCRKVVGRGSMCSSRVLVLMDQGDHAGVDRVAAEGLEVARSTVSPIDEALILAYRGTSLMHRGRVEEAREHLVTAQTLLTGHDAAVRTRAYVAIRTAELHLTLGDPVAALSYSRRGAEIFGGIADPHGRATAELTVAEALASLADPMARAVADAAIATLRTVANPMDRAIAIARYGRIGWQLGDRSAARACYEEAADAAARIGWGGPGTELRVALDTLGGLLGS